MTWAYMIYRLENVYDSQGNSAYDEVGLRSYAGAHLALGDGVRLAKRWRPLTLRVERERGRRLPDLTMLTGYALIGTESAWKRLAKLAGRAVERLPLRSSGPPWVALNVVNVVDALDRHRSRMSDDWGRARLVFVHARVEGHAIFKLANVIMSPVFVNDAFKEAVEAEGLEGLRFVPLSGAARARPKRLARARSAARITDAPIAPQLQTELEAQAKAALKRVRCRPADRPARIVKAILEHVDALHAARKKAPKSHSLALACLWGEQVCRALGWSWAQLRIAGKDGGIAIVSPRRHHVIYPLPYIEGIVADRRADNTILLLFNMLVGGNVPRARANEYVRFG